MILPNVTFNNYFTKLKIKQPIEEEGYNKHGVSDSLERPK